jgi:glycosyltransferase involved in cell wall biosynthesis
MNNKKICFVTASAPFMGPASGAMIAATEEAKMLGRIGVQIEDHSFHPYIGYRWERLEKTFGLKPEWLGPRDFKLTYDGLTTFGHIIEESLHKKLMDPERSESKNVIDVMYAVLKERTPNLVWTSFRDFAVIQAAERMGIPCRVEFPRADLAAIYQKKDFSRIRKIYRKAPLRICPSRYASLGLKKQFGLTSEVCYPCISSEHAILQPSNNLQSDRVLFLNDELSKGSLIAYLTAKNLPHVKFAVVRRMAQRDLPSFFQEKKLPNVEIWPFTRQVSSYYREAKVVIFPSLATESFGMVGAEATMNGIPVIANSIGGIPEALHGGGFLVPLNKSKQSANDYFINPKYHRSTVEKYVSLIDRLFADEHYLKKARQKAFKRGRLLHAKMLNQIERIHSRMKKLMNP